MIVEPQVTAGGQVEAGDMGKQLVLPWRAWLHESGQHGRIVITSSTSSSTSLLDGENYSIIQTI
jgi:hypothetical protein